MDGFPLSQNMKDNVSYTSKVNFQFVLLFIVAGFVCSVFFFWSGYQSGNRDHIITGVLFLFLSIILWILSSRWIELVLLPDRFVLTQKFFGKAGRIEIPYSEVNSVEISDYVANIMVCLKDGRKIKISSQVRKESGEVKEEWLDRTPLPSKRVKDLHMLRYELLRRAKLLGG